jgi:hypothetical protein
MNSSNTYPRERAFAETVDGVTYRGHWFIDNQVVVMYVGSASPLTKMILGASPEITARQLLYEFVASEVNMGRLQIATGSNKKAAARQVE